MSEFWTLLQDSSAGFVRQAFFLGALASVAFGLVGTMVVARRLSYLAGAIAHASLGGIGAALYAQRVWQWEWVEAVHGAVFAAILAGGLIALVRRWAADREDTLIGALWAVGMSLGLVFLALIPGYADPMAFLVGDILLVSTDDLVRVAVLDAVLIVLLIAFFSRLRAVCFDEEFAALRGLRVHLYYLVLLLVIGLTVVLLLSVVGVVLVVALLTLPAAAAGRLTHSLGPMLAVGVLMAFISIWGGLTVSFVRDWPTGPSIVLLSALLYLLVSSGKSLWRCWRGRRMASATSGLTS